MENLGFGYESISNNVTDIGTDIVKRLEDGTAKTIVNCRAVIQANTSLNITMTVIDRFEFENAKELFQPKVDEFVSQAKGIAIAQNVPFVHI